MLTVVTHVPSPALQECELTFVKSELINIAKTTLEHDNYCRMLEQCGARVVRLEDNILLPDSVFVEDPVIVFDEVAVLTSMGVESRRLELATLEKYFRQYRKVKQITLPARIEGGDVLKIGRRIYGGESARTNAAGIHELGKIIEPFGYEVVPVKVSGCLHLKTGCTALDANTILINSAWVDILPFSEFKIVETPQGEPFGANVLPINDTICMNDAFPETKERVVSLGYNVVSTDITEFVKAEAGLTCMSVPFYQKVT
jgi:dimethylargininase